METMGDAINNAINEFVRQQKEYTEKALAEIITKYDFVVGSTECKHKLMEILPEGANIISSPFIEDPTKIYAIKKFDATDLFKGFHLPDINSGKMSETPTGSKGNDKCKKCNYYRNPDYIRCHYCKAASEGKK